MLPVDTLSRIRQVVQDVIREGYCNSQGGASCGVTCEELSIQLGWGMTYGPIRANDGALIDDDHAWLMTPGGDIVDPTIGQFSAVITKWPGYDDIAVIPRGHPMHSQYGDSPTPEVEPAPRVSDDSFRP